jgi:phosphate transport system substrate-binding protein
MYTDGQPAGVVAGFINFVLSPAGQKLVAKEGFVPVAGEAKEKPSKKRKK